MSGERTEEEVVARVAGALLAAGAVVAALGVGAWVLDLLPPMPAWMLRLAVYKLTLAAGAGLMIAGAVLRRQLREAARRDGRESVAPGKPPMLGEPREVGGAASRDRENSQVRER
ncbi:MAG: hypothetical protein U9Q74_00040 [Gemmatimonadota bacterium]|nr:hypothetical protein [Gemmatimonadota bacterium]